jgi:hypothetical protein
VTLPKTGLSAVRTFGPLGVKFPIPMLKLPQTRGPTFMLEPCLVYLNLGKISTIEIKNSGYLFG